MGKILFCFSSFEPTNFKKRNWSWKHEKIFLLLSQTFFHINMNCRSVEMSWKKFLLKTWPKNSKLSFFFFFALRCKLVLGRLLKMVHHPPNIIIVRLALNHLRVNKYWEPAFFSSQTSRGFENFYFMVFILDHIQKAT